MAKFQIPRRTPTENRSSKLVIDMTDEMYEILRGALLGDGALSIGVNSVNARFVYSSKSYQHVEYVAKGFMDYGRITEADRFDPRTKKYNHVCYFHSKVSKTFTDEYHKWYIDGVKHIPSDLLLTPLTCLIWYIGDGCLRNTKTNSQRIILATNCFDKQEIETILLPQLKEFEASLEKVRDEQYVVRIGKKKNIKKFLAYIGSCPFSDYEYKWKVKENIRGAAGQSMYYDDENEFVFMYESGLSSYKIAKIYGCSDSNVLYVLNKNGINRNITRKPNYNKWDFNYLANLENDNPVVQYKIDAVKRYLEYSRI
jgi:hypothetical protein